MSVWYTHIASLSFHASSLCPLKSSNTEFSCQPIFLLWLFIIRYGWATKARDEYKMGWQLNMTVSHCTSADHKEKAWADRLTYNKQYIYMVYWWQFLTIWTLTVEAQKISDMLDSDPTMTQLTPQGLFTEHAHCEGLQYLTPSEYAFCKTYSATQQSPCTFYCNILHKMTENGRWFTDYKNMDGV